MSILAELSRMGKTVILVTHESMTAKYAKRIIKIKDGLIVSDGANKDVIKTEKINGQLK